MERGILFSKIGKVTMGSERIYSFAPVPSDEYLSAEENMKEITKEHADFFDAIGQNVILRHF